MKPLFLVIKYLKPQMIRPNWTGTLCNNPEEAAVLLWQAQQRQPIEVTVTGELYEIDIETRILNEIKLPELKFKGVDDENIHIA